eukprot:gene3964-4241_t
MSNNPSDQENQFEQSVPLLKSIQEGTNRDLPTRDARTADKVKGIGSPLRKDSSRKGVLTSSSSLEGPKSTLPNKKGYTDYGAIPLTEENLQTKNISDKHRPPIVSGPPTSQLGKLLDMKSTVSVDDFGETNSVADFKPLASLHTNKAIRSGRQRKKTAARSKGGEFQAKRKKRRIYFCSIGSEIDVEGVADKFLTNSHLGLRGKMYSEVLHLYVENIAPAVSSKNDLDERLYDHQDEYFVDISEDLPPVASLSPMRKRNSKDKPLIDLDSEVFNPLSGNNNANTMNITNQRNAQRKSAHDGEDVLPSQSHDLYTIDERDNIGDEEDETGTPPAVLPVRRMGKQLRSSSYPGANDNDDDAYQLHDHTNNHLNPSYDLEDTQIGIVTDLVRRDDNSGDHVVTKHTQRPSISNPYPIMEVGEDEIVANSHYWQNGGREVFVFDFGAVVFWGYHRDEVKDLLQFFKSYVVKGVLGEEEFKAGEDDMAFVLSAEAEAITIANDVVTLPEITSVKSRLAVSFAIAQSTILAIFEARIEEKIEDYKYIPETLAASGKILLSAKQLGNMIGEVFVIRHDVNLHNEILNIPDYFWKENSVEPLYRMTSMYLEMEPRTEVLNKRLDLLRELLKLLQHQHENSHNVKLEWIVIWLIVMSVVLELFLMVGKLLDLWD